MGRVKRYKKVKAMDPFAKGGGGGKMGRKNDDLDRNLPPDVKNHEAQRLSNLEGVAGSYNRKDRARGKVRGIERDRGERGKWVEGMLQFSEGISIKRGVAGVRGVVIFPSVMIPTQLKSVLAGYCCTGMYRGCVGYSCSL